ncbi:hypothetical protein KGF54_005112, partial [Candida jiufengensis]
MNPRSLPIKNFAKIILDPSRGVDYASNCIFIGFDVYNFHSGGETFA